MSRVGRQIISIPDKVEVALDGGLVSVRGPLGNLTRLVKSDVLVTVKDKAITLAPAAGSVAAKALWGTYASHIKNMVEGVTKGFTKKLIIEGIGYKILLRGNDLELDIGFSHSVMVPIPEGIKVTVDKNMVTISGYDKEKVGEFAARIRAYKKTEPYKGKGIRYEDERVRRKQGKKTVA